ncbi:hypothetical protein [Streptomyces sp. NPDC048295]|uniref:hypothetical protein n=1 Tax=Streptomyces sp. NPDC048295 TaxID=3154617 RepID=UPI00343CEFEE
MDRPTGRRLTDLAMSEPSGPEERRYVRTAMGVDTTVVKPHLAQPARSERVKKQ